MTSRSLASRQASLVAALVSGAPVPEGFDPVRVHATAEALLRKRAGEVGQRWPTLRAQFGPEWTLAFSEWARGIPPRGSVRDGWDFARHLARRGSLHEPATVDLAIHEACYFYDGVHPSRRRWLPALRRAGGTLVLQVAGHVLRLTLPR
jgi:hypothetical protein